MMDKAPDAYRTISEVGEDLDLPQHVLRFWETRFGQIKPLKRGGGRRYYRPDDVELLKGIRHLLYKEGYTIKGVQRILKEQGVKAVQAFVRESLSGDALAPPIPAGSQINLQNGPQAAHSPRQEPFIRVEAPVAAVAPHPHDQPALPQWESAGFPDAGMTPATAGQPPDTRSSPEAPGFAAPVHEWAPPAPLASELMSVGAMPSELSAPREPQSPREPAAAGQVSMFRGGLQRGEGTSQPASMAEFSNQIRERVEHPHTRADNPGMGARDALLIALEELITCRAVIDQVLAARQEEG